MNTNKKYFGLRTLIITMVIAVLLFGGISITGAAAQSAIPGDALYPVKTTIEQTRLSMAKDAGDRAQMRMGYAEQRLKEISALIDEGRYREVSAAVLAFESDMNSALLELDTVAKADPTRAASLALEITSTLTRYAQTLSALLASAPESVRSDVNRALDSTHLAGSLDLPSDDDDSNSNDNDDDNGDDNSNDNVNANANDNSDDNGNDNVNANANDNGDDSSNSNSDDDANDNGDDNSNTNSDDDTNSNGDDSSNTNSDDDANDNGDDSSNDNGDDDASNNGDDSGNDNGDDHGGDSGNDDASDDSSGDDDSGDDKSGKDD